jgi:hypothetical protein
VVDAGGNVYVAGNSIGSSTESDFATVKYDDTGIHQWTARYNGPQNFNDYVSAIAVDAWGNVYVAGYSSSIQYDYYHDYVTIKYDASGNEQWVVRYDGGDDDVATDLSVDGSGNVYVTGHSWVDGWLGPAPAYCTIKYDVSGNEQWWPFILVRVILVAMQLPFPLTQVGMPM